MAFHISRLRGIGIVMSPQTTPSASRSATTNPQTKSASQADESEHPLLIRRQRHDDQSDQCERAKRIDKLTPVMGALLANNAGFASFQEVWIADQS